MAYTKYSLTPANNTATPPDGAPEGMLPSAVNDTMRDMMAQIRDCGDGIRDGTYTMTAPKITGGTITGAAFTGNTFTSPVISGGSINNTPIGGTTANSGAFTTLSASGVATISAGTVSAPALTTTGDTNTGIFFPAADTIAFTEGGAEAMRIDSSGNVGIGTSSPSTQLQMNSSAATYSDQLRIRNTNFGNADIGVGSGIMAIATDMANITFYTSSNLGTTGSATPSNERMRITSTGNVGIGSTSPVSDRALTLNSTSNYFGIAFQTSGTTRGQIIQESTGNIYVDAGSDGGSGALIFRTTGTERMRITSGGDLLVGTTSALSNAAKVQISGGSGSTITSETTGTGATDHVNFRNGNGKVGTITTNGSATSYNTSSDYRLKENIAPMSGALNIVSALKPCTYTWKADGSAGQGFIAHELQAVVPDAVVGDKDAVDEEGKPIYQGVDTSFLVATLTAAIQEQQAMIEELKQEVAALKAK